MHAFLITTLDFRAWRFAVVGLANTAIGLTVIFACKALLGLGDLEANLIGYSAALILGFALNKRWTFEHRGKTSEALGRYLLVLAAAYLSNLTLVLFAIEVMGVGSYWAQAFGVVPYAMTGYLGSRFFAFAKLKLAASEAPGQISRARARRIRRNQDYER